MKAFQPCTHAAWPYGAEPCAACEWDPPLTRREWITLAVIGVAGAVVIFGLLGLLFLFGPGPR